MRLLVLLVTATAALALAGCGPAPAGGPSGPATTTTVPQPEALQPMAIIRTGGFAGVHETLEIDGDGRWTYSDGRGASRAGQLDEAARTRLATIQADPGLAAEIARIPDIGCCDQFDYELRISERTYTFEDLGDIGPLLRELLELLRAQTGY